MTRYLLPLLLAAPGFAQLPAVTLSVTPATEPKPALRFDLTVQGRDKVSGNAALHYAKAALARPTATEKKSLEDEKKVQGWEETPLDKLPTDDVNEHLAKYAAALRELEHGTKCKTCEWDSAPASGPAALDAAVASQPANRVLARMLSLRLRVELAEKRFDAATHTLRAGLQYAKHLGEGPTLIQMLVGHAVAAVFLGRAEEFVSCPDAPNLYWGLTALPRPLIDPRPGLDGEDDLTESFLPGLADLRKGPVTAERALDVAENALKVFAAASDEPNTLIKLGGRLAISGHATLHQNEAVKELVARGWDKKKADALPAVQAVFLNSFEAYREHADDFRKWFLVDDPEAFDGLAKATAALKKAQKERKSETMLQTFLLILPAVEKVHSAHARTDRKVAALRAVEAVRLHAGLAGGLPKQLSDIKKVPVPPDPLTGKSFVYEVTASGFTLISAESESVPKVLNLKYEVTVRK